MKNTSNRLASIGIALTMISMVFLQCTKATNETTSLAETTDSTLFTRAEPSTARLDTSNEPTPVPALTETATPNSAPSNTQPTVKQPEQPTPQKEVPRPVTSTQPKTQAEPVVKPVVAKETAPLDPAPVSKPTPAVKATPPTAPVRQSVNFSFNPSKGEIQGSSTLHAWTSAVTGIEVRGTFQLENHVIGAIQDLSVKIPVTGIKSKEGSKMDDKTYETLKSDSHPFITFTCKNAPVTIDAGQNVNVVASGTLSMAGASKSVTLSAKGKQLPNGDLQLSFSQKINMKDYQMEPPVMMLGTIKVGEEITVSFDFVLTKSPN